MIAARNASASQTLSHAAEFAGRAEYRSASQAAARAVAPRMTCCPAGDGGEGGGALHGIADEAEVGSRIGGEIGCAHGRCARGVGDGGDDGGGDRACERKG